MKKDDLSIPTSKSGGSLHGKTVRGVIAEECFSLSDLKEMSRSEDRYLREVFKEFRLYFVTQDLVYSRTLSTAALAYKLAKQSEL